MQVSLMYQNINLSCWLEQRQTSITFLYFRLLWRSEQQMYIKSRDYVQERFR